MDAGQTWTCAACGSGNAAYRRRCIDCAQKRPSEVGAPASEPGGIPLPRVARRRAGSGRGWPTVAGIVAVLALAAYGALSYFGADRPSAREDEAALVAALPAGSGPEGDYQVTELGGLVEAMDVSDARCPAEAREAARIATEHGTVAVSGGVVGGRSATIIAFDSGSAARRYDDLAQQLQSSRCSEGESTLLTAVEGRAWIVVVDGSEGRATLDEVIERLEIEG